MAHRFRLDDIQDVADLILAEPATDPKGRMLSAAGTAVTPALLAALERHGVTDIAVETVSVPDIEGIRGRLDKLFRKSGDGAASAELRQWVLSYRTNGAA